MIVAVAMAALFISNFVTEVKLHERIQARQAATKQQLQRDLYGRAFAVAVSRLRWCQAVLVAAAQAQVAEAERVRRAEQVAQAPPPKQAAGPAQPVESSTPSASPSPAGCPGSVGCQWWGDIVQAAARYGQSPQAMYRVMICESTGNARADNGVCKGLFQFNPGTWASTPYGSQSIWDGHAQAFATAWMWSRGRRDEWTCQ